MFQLHLIGAKAHRALALRAAAMSAHAEATQKAAAADPPLPPPAAPRFEALPLDGFSGRGVRLRLLDADERDKVAEIAARSVGQDATLPEYNRRRLRDSLGRCIVAVTKDGGLDPEALAKAPWVDVTQEQLEGKGAMSFKALFTTKDSDALGSWFRAHHEADGNDLDAIVGKAVELADEG